MDLSLVIPVYNEEESLPTLLTAIHTALHPTGWQYELVFVDDGSRDRSLEVLKKAQENDPTIVVVRFRRNCGQTAAFKAGFDVARGEVIVTLDADGQNPPSDIPALVQKLSEGYDVVNGWRENRQDGFLLRRLPSQFANRLIARATGVRLRDRGCSLRAFRANVVKELKLYGEMHRFIPELVHQSGFTMAEIPVNHLPRQFGTSKYGLGRTLRVLLDLCTVLFLHNYANRPMQLFGAWGIGLGGVGLLIGGWLSVAKISAGIRGGWPAFEAYQIGDRPILLLSVLLIILGVQFIAFGLLAELLVRTYYESQDKPIYYLHSVIRKETDHERTRTT